MLKILYNCPKNSKKSQNSNTSDFGWKFFHFSAQLSLKPKTPRTLVLGFHYKFQKIPIFHHLGAWMIKFYVFQYRFQKIPNYQKLHHIGLFLKRFSIFKYKFRSFITVTRDVPVQKLYDIVAELQHWDHGKRSYISPGLVYFFTFFTVFVDYTYVLKKNLETSNKLEF